MELKSGYVHCACYLCFETAIASDMSKPAFCGDCDGSDGSCKCSLDLTVRTQEYCSICGEFATGTLQYGERNSFACDGCSDEGYKQ